MPSFCSANYARSRSFPLLIPALLLAITLPIDSAHAQAPFDSPNPLSAQPRDRITSYVDDEHRITLKGNRPPLAVPEYDEGTVAPEYRMERMVLTLLPDSTQQQSLLQLLDEQQDPESPYYHHWLSPEQYGESFGVSEADTAQLTEWLESHGMDVDEIAGGRRAIVFSGTAAQVESAFHTETHTYKIGKEIHHANASEPQIPAAFSDVVGGVVSLHDFRSEAMNNGRRLPMPEFTSGSNYYLAPADFATIYDLAPAYQQSITGSGQAVAIVGRTNINLSDVRQFRSAFGLPAIDPQIIVNGTNPGIVSSAEETEADLDVEWSGAVARNATTKFVVSKSTNSTDGAFLSAQYIVSHNIAPVMSMSFGLCEAALGSSGNSFIYSLWQQAAAEGISVLVAAGDSGAAGCDSPSSSRATHGKAVNGLCSSPYSVCVGGTEFNDTSKPSLYWSPKNAAETEASALSYIPEMAWNESGSGGLWAGGGGASTIYPKPSWQSGTGVPADGKRDVPDVSLTAAGHGGYLIYQNGELFVVGGTSAAAPSFAGIMALVVQNETSKVGNANTIFYPLATKQRAGGAAVFHDITSGNNSVPGQTGFNATPAYDQATGLGSVDASVLIAHWGNAAPAPAFHLIASPNSVLMKPGSGARISLNVAANGVFTTGVVFSLAGLPSGLSAAFTPSALGAPGSGSATLKLNASGTLKAGTYPLTILATSAGVTQRVPISVTYNFIQAPPSPED
jgi:pseudomonalisin